MRNQIKEFEYVKRRIQTLFELISLIVGGSYVKGAQSTNVTQMVVEVNLNELKKTIAEILKKSARIEFDESQQVSGLSALEY